MCICFRTYLIFDPECHIVQCECVAIAHVLGTISAEGVGHQVEQSAQLHGRTLAVQLHIPGSVGVPARVVARAELRCEVPGGLISMARDVVITRGSQST